MIQTKKVIKAMSWFILFFFIFVSVFCYRQYEEYTKMQKNSINIKQEMNDDLKVYLKTILIQNVKTTESNLNSVSSSLHEDIISNYGGDLESLANDLKNPTSDSKIANCIGDRFKDSHSSIFVATMNNLLWINRNSITDKSKTISSWNDFNSFKCNEKLANNAYNSIKNMNYDKNEFIFWQSNYNNYGINQMSFDDLYDLYLKYGLDAFKSYEIIVPIYITNTGDIFGTKDIDSLGNRNKNYKIVIGERINMYDALSEFEPEITKYNDQFKYDSYLIDKQIQDKMITCIEVILFSLMMFMVSAILQNRITSKSKK